MSDDPKTQLLPLLALTLVLGGAYAALKLFGADEAPPEAAIAAGEGACPADATAPTSPYSHLPGRRC